MKKEITCYLAGPFCSYGNDSNWRDMIKGEVKITNFSIRFINPRIETRQRSISAFME